MNDICILSTNTKCDKSSNNQANQILTKERNRKPNPQKLNASCSAPFKKKRRIKVKEISHTKN